MWRTTELYGNCVAEGSGRGCTLGFVLLGPCGAQDLMLSCQRAGLDSCEPYVGVAALL